MIRISAFADEISPDLAEQIAGLREAGIRYLDLRSVADVNVLDLTDDQVASIADTLSDAGITVATIGSPIGKVPIDSPDVESEARFERALALAHRFQTVFVRIFSFYPPAHSAGPPVEWRDAVLDRLRSLTQRARAEGVILLHENEKGIYGDTIDRCVDLLSTISDAHFRAVFDPANFVQCGQEPYPTAHEALRPWLTALHVKDALLDGRVVPAGEGVCRWPEILHRLRADGWEGNLALEPHLESAGPFSGFSGPQRFLRAARALTTLLDAEGWRYE